MDEDACAAHCVFAFEVTLGDETSTHDCGDEVDLGEIEVDRDLTLSLRGVMTAGADDVGLTGQATVRATAARTAEVDIVLDAPARPSIDRVETPTFGFYGTSAITIEGSGFGELGEQGRVLVDGEAVEVTAWSGSTIEASTSGGSLVVERCGVASVPIELPGPAIDVQRITFGPSVCEDAVFIAGDAPYAGGGLDDEVLGLLDCPGSDRAMVVNFATTRQMTIGHWCVDAPGARDFSFSNTDYFWVLDDQGLMNCDRGAVSGSSCLMPACDRRVSETDVSSVAAVAGRVAYYGRDSGGLWRWRDQDDVQPYLTQYFGEVRALDNRFIIGFAPDGTATLLQDYQGIDVVEIDDVCTDPTGVVVLRPSPNGIVVVVRCGTRELMTFPWPRTRGDAFTTYTSIDDIDDYEISTDGQRVVTWASSGRIAFVDLATGQRLGTLQSATRAGKVGLQRAARRDIFLIGNRSGAVTRIELLEE